MKSPKKPDFIMLELLRSVYEIYYIDCTKQAIRNEFYKPTSFMKMSEKQTTQGQI